MGLKMKNSMDDHQMKTLQGKVLYLHPAIRNYRRELFERLSRAGVTFFWSASPRVGENGKSHSFDEINSILKETDISYHQANDLHSLPIDGFSFDLFKLPFSGYKVLVFSNIVSVPFLLISPLAKIMGKKIVVFDELWRYPKEIKKYRFLHRYVKFLVKYCVNKVVVAGSIAKRFYMEEFSCEDKSVVIAYNTTVDTQKIAVSESEDAKISNKLNTISSRKKLLYLGRIVKYKGLDVLIRAMKDVNADYDLIVVGDGEFRQECTDLVQALNLIDRVFFLGSCSSSESLYYYRHCDIFVLPTRFRLDSSVQMESWGFTINEAMAMERPVVTTEAVGSAYDLVIDGQTGYRSKAGDSESLSQSINQLIGDNRNNTLGINARHNLMEKCNYDDNFRTYMKVFEDLISEK